MFLTPLIQQTLTMFAYKMYTSRSGINIENKYVRKSHIDVQDTLRNHRLEADDWSVNHNVII